MRLVTFVETDADPASDPASDPATDSVGRPGVLSGDEIVDLSDPALGLCSSLADLLAAGPEALEVARGAPARRARRCALEAARLLAPVPRPAKVLGIGMNYAAHVAELGRTPPEHQVWFNKQRTCVVGPGEPIVIPSVSDQVDYEGELAFVIGALCRDVPAARAMSVIAGFTVMNDVSVRDWQWRSPTWTLGKSFDSHGPMGPWLVTPDEAPDPAAVRVRTWVNDELRQDGNTSDLIFDIGAMVELVSTACTLEPGDVITTGTPPGVGASFEPPRWLVAGDRVRITIDGIGTLENPVVAAPA